MMVKIIWGRRNQQRKMTVIFNAMVMGGTSIHSAFVKGNVLH